MVINQIMCTSKILKDLCFTKQNIKITNIFVRLAYNVLVAKIFRQNIKVCLSINNGAQSVKLEKGAIEFKNCFKQIQASFKSYADFECN